MIHVTAFPIDANSELPLSEPQRRKASSIWMLVAPDCGTRDKKNQRDERPPARNDSRVGLHEPGVKEVFLVFPFLLFSRVPWR